MENKAKLYFIYMPAAGNMGWEEIEMSGLILKTRPALARAMALPAVAPLTRAAGLAMAAVVAGSVFSAGWAAADLVLGAL